MKGGGVAVYYIGFSFFMWNAGLVIYDGSWVGCHGLCGVIMRGLKRGTLTRSLTCTLQYPYSLR